MKLKVVKTIPIWHSDDGSRTKYNVISEDGGVYATWSKAIGESDQGSEFNVIVEERENFGRKERFVKQTPSFGGNNNGNEPRTTVAYKDTESIERQVALKCAVEFAGSRSQMKAKDIVGLAEAFDQFLKKGKAAVGNQTSLLPEPARENA